MFSTSGLSDVSGNEGVPFSGYHLFFRNLEGVTEETVFNKMKKEGNTNGIRYWNLADFLSNFDVGINYNLSEDFILFRLRIAKDVFKNQFTNLPCKVYR